MQTSFSILFQKCCSKQIFGVYKTQTRALFHRRSSQAMRMCILTTGSNWDNPRSLNHTMSCNKRIGSICVKVAREKVPLICLILQCFCSSCIINKLCGLKFCFTCKILYLFLSNRQHPHCYNHTCQETVRSAMEIIMGKVK